MTKPAKIQRLYEDNHLLVIVKPVNVPSQADISGDPDVLTLLRQDIRERHNKPGSVFLALVHRLDRPVGGVMVLARTSKSASRLSAQMRAGLFGKIYLCVVYDVPEPAVGQLEHFLKKDSNKNIVTVVEKNTSGAKKALLEYETLESSKGLSLLRVRLFTGRPHQIRVQLAETGHPLYGDQKYGAEFARTGQQIALWSSELTFSHPTRKEEMHFTSTPPRTAPWTVFHLRLDHQVD